MFRKEFLNMTQMVRIIYQERNERMEGEGSKFHKEGDGSSGGHHDEDKSKNGNGGNGGNGEPSSSPSSSSSSTSSSVHQPHKSNNTSKSDFLKLMLSLHCQCLMGKSMQKSLIIGLGN